MAVFRKPLRARRWLLETLEARIAPSDTLLILGAAIAAAQSDQQQITQPQTAQSSDAPSWQPDETTVPISIIPPAAPNSITVSPQALDELLDTSIDVVSSDLGDSLGPDNSEPSDPELPITPRPATPAPIPPGVGSGSAPSGSAAPGGGGGGGGGGGQFDAAATGGAQLMTTMMFTPVANPDSFTTSHDTQLGGNVLSNDSGSGNISIVTQASHGIVSVFSMGQFSYTPATHYVGSDSFSYRFFDFMSGQYSNTASVTIDVTDHAPNAVNDSYMILHDHSLNVGPSGVLANDSDMDINDHVASASLVSGPSDGQLQFNSDGSFNYTPPAHFFGIVSFAYNAFDVVGVASQAIATINVYDNAPTALNDGVDADGNVLWTVSYRKAAAIEDQNRWTADVRANDEDMDADPLVAVLDTVPAGNLQLEQGPTGAWDGKFTYWPATGQGPGIDSFTYHLDDGAKESNVATVKIRVLRLDLDLFDGGHPDDNGNFVPGDVVDDYQELTRGAYAVANWNDTNGSRSSDNTEHPVSRDLDAGGYGEYDLMKLIIYPPSEHLPGEDKLAVYFTEGLDVWATPNKMPFLDDVLTGSPDNGGRAMVIDLADLPMTVYVEAISRSNGLRDMAVSEQYDRFRNDVAVTGIWVDATGMSNGQTHEELMQSFPDLDPELSARFPNGTGVLPTNITPGTDGWPPLGTSNPIVFQFTVMPLRGPADGTWEHDNIFFDATRRMSLRTWYKTDPDADWQMITPDQDPKEVAYKDWPRMVEEANDDPVEDVDSSKEVTALGHIYSADYPTILLGNPGELSDERYLANAREFVRVEIDAGSRVSGNGWKYSRGSDVVPWHFEIWTVQDALNHNIWVRHTGDTQFNTVGPGDINNGKPTD